MATEKRLIELDKALLVTAGEIFPRPLPEHDEVLLATVRKKLRNLLYVDAVEVVHGRWIGYHEADIGYDEYGVRCSNCNFEVEDHEVDFIMNYCPNCGAKMDGDGNGT